MPVAGAAALPVGSYLLVALAGAACGIVNSIAGGGSLILFPTLLLTGHVPLSANVTNSVTTWPGYLGGVGAFRTEIHTRRHQLPVVPRGDAARLRDRLRAAPRHARGVLRPGRAVAGARRHDHDGDAAHRSAAPQGPTTPPTSARRPRPSSPCSSRRIYGGYFGAALGVIVLAALSLTLNDTVKNLNATKSIISLVDASVSVVVFGLFGPVEWIYVAVAAPTTLAGGYLGGRIAQKLDQQVLRALVVGLGILVTIALFVEGLDLSSASGSHRGREIDRGRGRCRGLR